MTEPNTQRDIRELAVEYGTTNLQQIDRINKLLTKVREETERQFLNQDANAHDEAVRKSYRQELRKKVKGKSKSCTDECMSQFYDHDCCNCGAREYNQCKDDLLTIISE